LTNYLISIILYSALTKVTATANFNPKLNRFQ